MSRRSSMAEQGFHKAKVSGSNPLAGTKNKWVVSVAWLNASPCHGEDQGFESPTTRPYLKSQPLKAVFCALLLI